VISQFRGPGFRRGDDNRVISQFRGPGFRRGDDIGGQRGKMLRMNRGFA